MSWQTNLPESGDSFVFQLQMPGSFSPSIAEAKQYYDKVLAAYLKTSIACHLYNEWELVHQNAALWSEETQRYLWDFSRKRGREFV
jgi:hypothetical protein